MPIRPENRSRYPVEWRRLSLRIRAVRAQWRCECIGECGEMHDGGAHTDGRCDARNNEPHPVTGSNVVLTVAHLDHTPEHCDEDNLLAMCQRCHLRYDADHHRRTARRTRQRGQLDLIPED